MVFYLFSTGWTKNLTNILCSHRSYCTHYLRIFLHNIRTLSLVETRAVCQNVYGVPWALYHRQRIVYTIYIYNTHTHTDLYAFSLSVSLFLYLSGSVFVFLFLSFSPPFTLNPRQNVPVRTCIPSALLCAHISRISATEIVWLHSKDTPSGVSALLGKDEWFNVCFQS
jgi:hypothetical protein